jgi:hypothetical protein
MLERMIGASRTMGIDATVVARTIAFALAAIAPFAAAQPSSPETVARLAAVVTGEHRSDWDKARDVYRHPVETLAFFGIREELDAEYLGRFGKLAPGAPPPRN